MQYTSQLLVSALFLLVLSTQVNCAIFIPTSQECGTSDQVVAVTYPYIISTNRNDFESTIVKWDGPKPHQRISLLVDGREESYIDHSTPSIYESNGTSATAMFEYNLQSITWEASGIKTSQCEGYYQIATLPNGAVVEFTWEVFAEDHHYLTGSQTITAKKHVPRYRFYLSNYPYAYPNVSVPSIQFYYGLSAPVPSNYAWTTLYGATDRDPVEPNVTLAASSVLSLTSQKGLTDKQRGYGISLINNTYQFMDYAVLNGDQHTAVFVRGLVYSVEGVDAASFQAFYYFNSTYTGINDTIYYDTRLATTAEVEVYEGSSCAGVKTNFLKLFSLIDSFL